MSGKVFSGEGGIDLWRSIQSLNDKSTMDGIKNVLYDICVKIQELEDKLDEKHND